MKRILTVLMLMLVMPGALMANACPQDVAVGCNCVGRGDRLTVRPICNVNEVRVIGDCTGCSTGSGTGNMTFR